MDNLDSPKHRQSSSSEYGGGESQKSQNLSVSKSDEIVTNTLSPSKTNSLKSERDVKFAVSPTVIHDNCSEKDVRFRENKTVKDVIDRQDSRSSIHSPKVPRKYFTNWRQACDKTKDRTKELLKRWRTLPESDDHHHHHNEDEEHFSGEKEQSKGHGWSVHVWTTWVNRCSIDGGDGDDDHHEDLEDLPEPLSQVQAEKLSLFFTEILDMDHDDLVSEQDFEHFCEKLAHFADWSTNSPEYHILLEVKAEFVDNFIEPLPIKYREKSYWRKLSAELPLNMVDCENWLARWSLLLPPCSRFHKLPLFLQYLCKILFGVINRSGSGEINQQELRDFYTSVVGLSSKHCDEIMDTAFEYLTSKHHLPLDFETYKRCFSNWLCGKNPNGPGQWILVPPKGLPSKEPFPVDYSALNTDPAHLEKYTPNIKTNRHSVIV